MPEYVTRDEGETIRLGETFSRRLKGGDVVAVSGELGAGKTRFIKGVCRGLGVSAQVSSPTFTIVHEYRSESHDVFHFDFYRLAGANDVANIGFEEYVGRGGICLIEWPERASSLLPQNRYDVRLAHLDEEEGRRIVIEAVGDIHW